MHTRLFLDAKRLPFEAPKSVIDIPMEGRHSDTLDIVSVSVTLLLHLGHYDHVVDPLI